MSDARAQRAPRVLLIACYELGHQPLSLAWPAAVLRQAGIEAALLDLAVQPFDAELARQAEVVGISVPMHTALRMGVEAARRVRAANPGAHICFYGLYAWLNAAHLLAQAGDSVLAGEAEPALLALVQALGRGEAPDGVPGVTTRLSAAKPSLARVALPLPARGGLPALEQYAQYVHQGRARLAGYVEATRGCLHTCRHCPITPVYQGRFFGVPANVVLDDIRQQVQAGAGHITFGDPDFLNGPGHALAITRALHAEFPNVTFDFTVKVEHILKHRGMFAEFAELGCTFVTSAIESLSDRVLERLDKGHSAADVAQALDIVEAAGLAMQPTLVAFTPWTTLDDYQALTDFIAARGLQRHIAPVQLGIRLLLPPGSPLTQLADAAEWLGELDSASFGYRWRHPDPAMDRLYEVVAQHVAAGERAGEAAEVTHAAVRALAYAAGGCAVPEGGAAQPKAAPPRLTENWFC